jgi:hypothetical protein
MGKSSCPPKKMQGNVRNLPALLHAFSKIFEEICQLQGKKQIEKEISYLPEAV